ncbi:hypothetical protein C8J56DRAFT_915590 [Mycena floridula]|nr:hypothetical protein C8J56DRAFT_915590 [Mycena floridula]
MEKLDAIPGKPRKVPSTKDITDILSAETQDHSSKPGRISRIKEVYIFLRDEIPKASLVPLLVICLGIGPGCYALDRMTPESRDFYDPASRTLMVALACASILSSAATNRRRDPTFTVPKSDYFCMTFICTAFTTVSFTTMITPSFRFFSPNHSWNDVAVVAMSAICTCCYIALLWIMAGGKTGNLLSNSSSVVMGLWWLALFGFSQYGIRLNDLI